MCRRFDHFFQRKKKELDEYDRQQGERRAKIFESATEFILNLLAKTNRRFTEYEIHQRLVNTTFLDSGTLRDGKLIENGPTGTEMQQNITQANVGQALMQKTSIIGLILRQISVVTRKIIGNLFLDS